MATARFQKSGLRVTAEMVPKTVADADWEPTRLSLAGPPRPVQPLTFATGKEGPDACRLRAAQSHTAIAILRRSAKAVRETRPATIRRISDRVSIARSSAAIDATRDR